MKTLSIDGLRRNHVGAVSGALWGLGAVGVQETWDTPPQQPWDETAPDPPDRVLVQAWFESPALGAVSAALARWLDASCDLTWTETEQRDWQQEYLDSLVRIELPWITIAPPAVAAEGDLLIDPGAGFGTGEHATTKQILTMLPRVSGENLLDIGAGSGILALAAQRLGYTVQATEIDADARENARHNAELNGMVLHIDGRQPHELEPADVVLANLHAELLIRFAPDLKRLARGHLLLAGILAEKLPAVLEAYGTPLEQMQDGDWVALRC